MKNNKRKTLNEFVKEFRQKFPEKDYCDFSESTYVNNRTKMIVFCKIHNIYFEATPYSLLKGITSCPECKKEVDRLVSEKNIINGRNSIIKFVEEYYPDYYLLDPANEYKDCRSLLTLVSKIDSSIINKTSLQLKSIKYNNCQSESTGSDRYISRYNREKLELIEIIKNYDSNIDTSLIDYKGYNKLVILICKKHPETKIYLTPITIKNRVDKNIPLCDKCKEEKKYLGDNSLKEEFVKKIKEKYPTRDYDFTNMVFINYRTNIIIHCNKHNIDFDVNPWKLLNYGVEGCPKCDMEFRIEKKRQKEEKKFLDYMNSYFPEFQVSSEIKYINSITPIKLICKKHNEEILISPWDIKFNTPRLKRDICPKCTEENKRLENSKLFIEKAILIHGSKYNYDKVNFINYDTNVTGIVCNKCGLVHSQNPYSHLRGYDCCNCYSNYKSLGEQYVEKWLNENNILDYVPEFYISDSEILNKTNKSYVRIDFKVFYNNIEYWIEPSGAQHYKKVDIFQKTEEDFLNQLSRDESVRNYCKNHNIIYIEIPYTYDTYIKISDILKKIILEGENTSIIRLPKIKYRKEDQDG